MRLDPLRRLAQPSRHPVARRIERQVEHADRRRGGLSWRLAVFHRRPALHDRHHLARDDAAPLFPCLPVSPRKLLGVGQAAPNGLRRGDAGRTLHGHL